MTLNSYNIFKIEDIFTMTRGERQTEASREKGNVPYYSASQDNNGVTDFISNPTFTSKNKIVVSTFCHAYWAEGTFSASDEMTLLGHDKLNKYNALYICKIIEQNAHMYGFNRKAFSHRLKKQKIILPIKKDSSLDWEYMEQQGKRLYERKQNDIFEYLKKKQLELKTQLSKINEPIIEEITWKTFEVEEMFGVKRVSGEPLNKYDEGNLPFISTSSQKNGVQGFVNSKKEDVSPKNSLTISPIDGIIFFHSYNFVGRGGAGSSISIMTNENLNKYIGLFIKTMIEASSKHKASYGVQLNGKRLKSTKFYLPVTDDNEPDWKFMEYYMKNIEYKQLSKLIEYLN